MYTPEVGDSVAARRKVKSRIFLNTVVGPVTNVWPNACEIRTNAGTDIETEFRMYFSDWTFQRLPI